MEKKKVLCVCMGNTGRSPMMERMLQKELGGEFLVESAGVLISSTGKPADENAILCMRERGFDLSDHIGRWIGNLKLSLFSHIVCVNKTTEKAISKLLGKNEKEVQVFIANGSNGGIQLPKNAGLSDYRRCIKTLDKAIPEVAKIIRG